MKKLLIAGLILANALGMAQTNVAENLTITYLDDPLKLTSPAVFIDYINDKTAVFVTSAILKEKVTAYIVDIGDKPRVEIPLKFTDNRSYAFLKIQNERLLAFSSKYDKKEKTNTLFVEDILIKEGGLKGNISEIHSTKELGSESKVEESSINYSVSLNKSKLLFYSSGEKTGIQFSLYDNEMNKLSEAHYSGDYDLNLFKVIDYKVADNGKVHTLVKFYQDKKKTQVDDECNIRYSIFTFDEEGNFSSEIKLGKKELFYHNVGLALDYDQNAIVFGLYSSEVLKNFNNLLLTGSAKEREMQLTSGKYICKIDGKTSSIIKENHELFTKDYLRNFLSEKRFEKEFDENGDPQIQNLVLRNFSVSKTNEIFIVVENYNTFTAGSGDNRTMVMEHMSIMILGASRDAEFTFNKQITRAIASNMWPMNIMFIPNEEGLTMVYLNHPSYENEANQYAIHSVSTTGDSFGMFLTNISATGDIDTEYLAYMNKSMLHSDGNIMPYLSTYGINNRNQFALFGTGKGFNAGIWFLDFK